MSTLKKQKRCYACGRRLIIEKMTPSRVIPGKYCCTSHAGIPGRLLEYESYPGLIIR